MSPAGKKQNTKKGSKLLAPLIIVISALIFLAPLYTRLTLRGYHSNKLMLAVPIEPNETFKLRFTHSVNLSYVTDEMEWTGQQLITRTSLFTSFGAGMPVIADGIGTEMHNTEDGFLITGIDEVQEDNFIPIMLQEVPDHHLLYRDMEISLRDEAEGTAFVKLSVEKVSLISAIIHNIDRK